LIGTAMAVPIWW